MPDRISIPFFNLFLNLKDNPSLPPPPGPTATEPKPSARRLDLFPFPYPLPDPSNPSTNPSAHFPNNPQNRSTPPTPTLPFTPTTTPLTYSPKPYTSFRNLNSKELFQIIRFYSKSVAKVLFIFSIDVLMCSLYFRSLFSLSSALAKSPRWVKRPPAAPTRHHLHQGSLALSTEGGSGRRLPEAEEEDREDFKTFKLHTKCLTLRLTKNLRRATVYIKLIFNTQRAKDTKYISNSYIHNLVHKHDNAIRQNILPSSSYLKHFSEGFLARFIEHSVCNRSGSRSTCSDLRLLELSKLVLIDWSNTYAVLWYLRPLAAGVGYQIRILPMEGFSSWSLLKHEHEPDG